MKSNILLSGIAAALFAVTAQADVTIDITGANAFRAAATNTVIASFGAGITGIAHNGTAAGGWTGATQSIYRGSYPGIAGVTTIRCTFTGSVEGIRDLAVPQTQVFLTSAAFTQGTAGGPNERFGVPAGSSTAFPKFAFSDVYPTSSPYDVSNITDSTPGVVVFCMVANEGAPAGLSNVNSQQFRALMGAGFLPLRVFTGVATDTTLVYATGRYDLSGTRTTYLAESGYGFTNAVNQWKPTVVSGAITTLQRWPTGDGTNASSVWNGDIAGNGGFSSGGTLATAIGATSASVQRKQANGTNIGAPVPLFIVSATSLSDALTGVAAGGKALAYNGVGITPANPLSAADKAKVTEGAYTLWGYEHLMYAGSLSPDQQTFFDDFSANIPANIGASGVPFADMHASRSDDGGVVNP